LGKVITYGTFDIFHEGHYRLLERAKQLGNYLIVGVTTENFDDSRGKLNVQESLMKRIDNVRNSGLADEIIIEEYEGQKINDIQKYEIDVFAIGSDWVGKFDYLKEYCQVVYLERTKGISSTRFGAGNTATLEQYLTFVLRSLGYRDGTDFEWTKSAEFSEKAGILLPFDTERIARRGFYRDHVVYISYYALQARLKNRNITLLDNLVSKGVITRKQATSTISAHTR